MIMPWVLSYRCGMTLPFEVSTGLGMTHSEVSHDIHVTIVCDDGDAADDDDGDDNDDYGYDGDGMTTTMKRIISILNWHVT